MWWVPQSYNTRQLYLITQCIYNLMLRVLVVISKFTSPFPLLPLLTHWPIKKIITTVTIAMSQKRATLRLCSFVKNVTREVNPKKSELKWSKTKKKLLSCERSLDKGKFIWLWGNFPIIINFYYFFCRMRFGGKWVLLKKVFMRFSLFSW